jgi:hypothetical protein
MIFGRNRVRSVELYPDEWVVMVRDEMPLPRGMERLKGMIVEADSEEQALAVGEHLMQGIVMARRLARGHRAKRRKR